ncbi:acyl--CoA ligase [Sphingomonas sinipercae]|uniref:Acyl--CoA ligase n=1 Tax=Sphingomonas sinipercae TaxID=2714944 RepID=A0A6G7ZLH1_9SPHN|nr:class I adenylate-forming enzyme family protein [Sphingomonas sinipercae]QIL01768.1 acyl--CoA ligase [Sphingomonas sinipercae]
MASELDRRFDEMLAKVIGPGGRMVIGEGPDGRPIATNFPPTLSGLFTTFCALYPDREAVVAGDERLTFGDLERWAQDLAPHLAARGIGRGDRVAIAMRNCPAWIVSYMALAHVGAVIVLVNGWWQSHEMKHGLDLVEPKLVLADPPRAKRIAATGRDVDIAVLDVGEPLAEALRPLMEVEPATGDLPQAAPEDDATILFTSGSTGEAKGAVSTQLAVVTGTYSYAVGLMTLLGLLTEEGRAPETPPRTLLSVPLFHVTGEVPVMLNSFVVGRCMVVMPKWDAGEALRLIEKERISYFVGVPTMSLELMNHPDRDRYDLSSLKDITAGGAPRPVTHVQRIAKEFPHANPAMGYGLTETNACGASNFWGSYAAKPASTGRAQKPFVDLAILGEGDLHLGSDQIGEVAIRTASNIRGYWRNPEATAAAFTADGYVRTGDIGFLDDEGYLFIVDRKKEIIIRGGENISSAEVEAACYECQSVAEVAVFGVPDERLGEVPIAILHCRDGLNEQQLRTFLEPRLAAFKIPARMIFSDEPLPRLGTGKIDRVALKAKYAA